MSSWVELSELDRPLGEWFLSYINRSLAAIDRGSYFMQSSSSFSTNLSGYSSLSCSSTNGMSLWLLCSREGVIGRVYRT